MKNLVKVAASLHTATLAAAIGLTQPIMAEEFFSTAGDRSPFYSTGRLNDLIAKVDSKSGVTVVLIPGILGSKLTTANGNLIWGGGNTSDPDLQYDPAQKVQAAIFDKVEIDAFFKTFDYNVYGDAIVDIEDLSPDGRTRLEKFPYDWRQSNLKSADRLQEWVCAKADSLKGRKVIFVAHSMGGLVLKAWLMTHYDNKESCAGTPLREILDINQLIFVGTPHAGAPIFVSALVNEYELLKDHPIINRFLSWGLNNYGSSFESIYELLPIVQSTDCRTRQKIETAPYIYLGTPGRPPQPIDLFAAEEWARLGIPKKRHIADADKFYKEFLPPQLARAQKMLCDMWGYKYGDLRGKVTSIYGEDKDLSKNTATRYIVTRWRNVTRGRGLLERLNRKPDDIVVDSVDNGLGDGTVPEEVARTAPERKFAHRAENSHQALLDDRNFKELLFGQIWESKFALLEKATSDDPKKVEIVVRHALENNMLFPVGRIVGLTNAFQSPSSQLAWASRINNQVLARQSADWTVFAKLAKTTTDAEIKGEAYAQIIASSAAPIASRINSANNLGYMLLADRKFSQAEHILSPAAMALQDLPEGQYDKKLAGKLFNNTGWASLKKGLPDQAKSYFTDSKELGNAAAASGLRQVDVFRKILGESAEFR